MDGARKDAMMAARAELGEVFDYALAVFRNQKAKTKHRLAAADLIWQIASSNGKNSQAE